MNLFLLQALFRHSHIEIAFIWLQFRRGVGGAQLGNVRTLSPDTVSCFQRIHPGSAFKNLSCDGAFEEALIRATVT